MAPPAEPEAAVSSFEILFCFLFIVPYCPIQDPSSSKRSEPEIKGFKCEVSEIYLGRKRIKRDNKILPFVNSNEIIITRLR